MTDNTDELETRIKQLTSELRDINLALKTEIAKQGESVPFEQVKEIEGAITRLNRQGLPVPAELKELKLKLILEHDRHQERIALYKELQKSISESLDQETHHNIKQTTGGHSKANRTSQRKLLNNERPLGSKGYSNLGDYLIPVIKLMWKGLDHAAAFSKIAQVLDVRYNTVSSQCTRALDLTTDEFVRQVNSKAIVSSLKKKYPDQHHKIKEELNI